jgi:chemotaxis methyl-accepting protein methylase
MCNWRRTLLAGDRIDMAEPLFGWSEIEISATDLNTEALARARAGIYRPRSFRSLPQPILMPILLNCLKIVNLLLSDDIRARVHFSHLNLMDQKMMVLSKIMILFFVGMFLFILRLLR